MVGTLIIIGITVVYAHIAYQELINKLNLNTMEIIPVHYKISKPVTNWKEISKEVEEVRRFIVRGKFKGFYDKAFAIAHCQVSDTPYAFFVVAPEVVKEKMLKDEVIINPEIIDCPVYKKVSGIDMLNAIDYNEACMSFPFRKEKRIRRYDYIKVKYQIPTMFGIKDVEQELYGIASQIFQHEYDHLQGKNIYFESETPVKWWELIGTPQSKGGTSLDNADDLNLRRQETKPI